MARRKVSVNVVADGNFCDYSIRVDLTRPVTVDQLEKKVHQAFKVRPPQKLAMSFHDSDGSPVRISCDSTNSFLRAIRSSEQSGTQLLITAAIQPAPTQSDPLARDLKRPRGEAGRKRPAFLNENPRIPRLKTFR